MALDYNTRSDLIDGLSAAMGISAADTDLANITARYDKGTGTLYCGNGRIYKKEHIEAARHTLMKQQERIKASNKNSMYADPLEIAINIMDVYLNDSTIANKTLTIKDPD